MTADMRLETNVNEHGGRARVMTLPTRRIEAAALTAMLLTLWSLTHTYGGLSGDAELYAVQALAKILPTLGNDIFLRATSQDHYTLFSPFYAVFIRWLGVPTAAVVLTILAKIGFYGAAWTLVRAFANARQAFLAVALLIVIKGTYGAYGVFRYSEDFLTARSVAEVLVLGALALYHHGHRLAGLLLASAALCVHPLMALPGLLLIVCLRTSQKWSVVGAAAGVATAFAIACYGSVNESSAGLFAALDPPWLEVVRERSQFLFVQLWSANDWNAGIRPFISLAITLLASRNAQIRRLCWASMLVGATGLAIAFIAGTVGPVAILLQGQAWRWLWIASFLSVALLVSTVIDLCRDENAGPLCSLLLILGWTYPAINCLECLVSALLIWVARRAVPVAVARYFRWAALGLSIIVILWMLRACWDVLVSPSPKSGLETLVIARARGILGLQLSAAVIAWLVYKWVSWSRSITAMLLCSVALAATAAVSIPGAFLRYSRGGAGSEWSEFEEWRSAIPPGSNVFVLPAHNSATFAWFTLERPSYLTVDQSSGVVFSRETALEVERRSEVLLPLLPPDWKLLSAINDKRHGVIKDDSSPPTITRSALMAICGDPQLAFVVAKQDVGFDPIRHPDAGTWKDWNLYDCSHVRSTTAGL